MPEDAKHRETDAKHNTLLFDEKSVYRTPNLLHLDLPWYDLIFWTPEQLRVRLTYSRTECPLCVLMNALQKTSRLDNDMAPMAAQAISTAVHTQNADGTVLGGAMCVLFE